MDEILVENIYRNPEGNPLIVDTILLEKVISEPNITLLLNTVVHDLEKSAPDTIRTLRAFCSQNSTVYKVTAPFFVDASGDGIVGFLAGAAFRVGAEASAEFGEQFASSQPSHELLGHTLYFYSKETGHPVKFVPPSFALGDITRIPRWSDFSARDSGCRLWWIEWGGQLDTVHDSETIKWELWKVAYGVWNYIKNSGKFPEAETLTLEWVGTIPGKRESRRFEGDYILRQQDIVEQRKHPDAVSFGGWAIDLHPAEGVFSDKPGCMQWHSKGVYQIPYRCLYSRNIANLFLAGRIISASHVAFGSTRVMAVAIAAALCLRNDLRPRDLLVPARMAGLQNELLRRGQYIPGFPLSDLEDLARRARLSVSSELKLKALRPDGTTLTLSQSLAMMIPVHSGPMPRVSLTLDVSAATDLQVELRVSSNPENHTPDATLQTMRLPLEAGTTQEVGLRFDAIIDKPRYAFICLMKNELVSVHLSDQRVTGIVAVSHNGNRAVTKSSTQTPPPDSGFDTFEFWTPYRRPGGKNFAITLDPPLEAFGASNLANGICRPVQQPNAWVSEWKDATPWVRLVWPKPTQIGRIELVFDTDYDHPMESVLLGHPERIMPFCIQQFQICDAAGRVLFECRDNHHSRQSIRFDAPVIADELTIRLNAPSESIPAALFEIRCYED